MPDLYTPLSYLSPIDEILHLSASHPRLYKHHFSYGSFPGSLAVDACFSRKSNLKADSANPSWNLASYWSAGLIRPAFCFGGVFGAGFQLKLFFCSRIYKNAKKRGSGDAGKLEKEQAKIGRNRSKLRIQQADIRRQVAWVHLKVAQCDRCIPPRA